jgi:hypothetical protein
MTLTTKEKKKNKNENKQKQQHNNKFKTRKKTPALTSNSERGLHRAKQQINKRHYHSARKRVNTNKNSTLVEQA